MSGIVLHIFAFGVIGIFVIVITGRTLAIIRLPIHLRWELAPMNHTVFYHCNGHSLSAP